MGRGLKSLLGAATVVVVVMAIWQELNTPSEMRTWHGRVAGVPYDFRPPTLDRVQDALWNPYDRRLFKPQVFGVGWTLNLGRLVSLVSGSR